MYNHIMIVVLTFMLFVAAQMSGFADGITVQLQEGTNKPVELRDFKAVYKGPPGPYVGQDGEIVKREEFGLKFLVSENRISREETITVPFAGIKQFVYKARKEHLATLETIRIVKNDGTEMTFTNAEIGKKNGGKIVTRKEGTEKTTAVGNIWICIKINDTEYHFCGFEAKATGSNGKEALYRLDAYDIGVDGILNGIPSFKIDFKMETPRNKLASHGKGRVSSLQL